MYKVTDITMVYDHIDFKTPTVIQFTHNHDNHHCVLKNKNMYRHGTCSHRFMIYIQNMDRKNIEYLLQHQ